MRLRNIISNNGLGIRFWLAETPPAPPNPLMQPFGPSDNLDQIAARNNAAWCAAVWRSHALPVEVGPGLVACPARTPRFYPNVVTIDRDASPAVQVSAIRALSDARPDIPLAVKDSFARLDLAPLGFAELFEARWIHRRAMADPATPGPLSWRRIETEAELSAWEAAWTADGDPARVFRSALLADPSVAVLAGFDADGVIRAGGVANLAAGVVGLSNIFGSRRGVIQAAAALWPEQDMVGYESGNDLKAMEYYGFSALGPLRVWVRKPVA